MPTSLVKFDFVMVIGLSPSRKKDAFKKSLYFATIGPVITDTLNNFANFAKRSSPQVCIHPEDILEIILPDSKLRHTSEAVPIAHATGFDPIDVNHGKIDAVPIHIVRSAAEAMIYLNFASYSRNVCCRVPFDCAARKLGD